MEIEDHDFQLVRKNLNILSVVFLVLAFTNAEINDANLLGISMKLNGSKFYISLYAGYAYFVWRFLTKLPLRTGFWNDFCAYYMNEKDGAQKEHNYHRYRKQLVEVSARLRNAIEINDPYFRLNQWSITRASSGLRDLKLTGYFQGSGRQDANDQQQFSVDYQITVSKTYVFAKLVKFCVKYDKFGDYLFPLVPVVSVFLFFLLKSDWQGSFYSLFINS